MSHRLKKSFGFVLFPLAVLFGIIVRIRHSLFNSGVLKSVTFDVPIICIGNITVGGTGKTPQVEYLLELLSEKFKVAVLSRGYKRKTKGFIEAKKRITPEEIGDEPYQIRKKFDNIKLAVCEKRVVGVTKLLEKHKNLQAIVLDDAFQHRHINPGVNILLIDYHRPVFKDYFLPYGNLRDSKSQIKRAQIVIVTKVPHDIKPIEKRIWINQLGLFPYQYLFFSSYEYGDLVPVFGRKKKHSDIQFLKDSKAKVLLLTGIANPKPLYDYLLSKQIDTQLIKYPDHYNYTLEEIKRIKNKFNEIKTGKKIIITTEKDAVKLQQIKDFPRTLKEKIYYLPIKVNILDSQKSVFDKLIVNYVKKGKEINRLNR